MAVRSLLVPVSAAALTSGALVALAGVAGAQGLTPPPGPPSGAITSPEPSRAPGATGAADPFPGLGPGPPPATGEPPRPPAQPLTSVDGEAAEPPALKSDPVRPPPLHVEYAQYGVALHALVNLDAGAMCGHGVTSPSSPTAPAPCILGSGGGLIIRIGYRSPGPWYFGGAYSFAKMDSSNLFRLGIFQQLWAEMRYLPDTGHRVAPFATWGLGGVMYGNEWGAETGGAMLFVGTGLQFEVSRIAVVGLGFSYKPSLIAGWTDTAGYMRPLGVAQFFGFDFQLEVRSEVGRR